MTFLKHRAVVDVGEIVPPVDEELFSAARNGDAKKLRARLAAGTPPDHPYGDEACMTPLIYAINGCHYECMRILLEAGADVNLSEHVTGHPPLRAALHSNDPKAVEILLEFNADPGHKSVGMLPDGTKHAYITDKELAHMICTPEIAKMVKDAHWKFRVNEMAHDNIDAPEAMRELLASGVPVDIKNYNGQTALHYACLHHNYDTAKLLLEAGADTEIEWNTKGQNALRLACYPSIKHEASPELVQLLIAHGADVNKLDERGRSIAHAAARTGDRSLLKVIVANGLSLTAKDAEGRTPGETCKEWSKDVEAAPLIDSILEVEEIGKRAQRLENPVKTMKKISFGPKN
ncbi:MAG: ankyrin repeat domain-containing protein [Alphaproteobacteria bacterium]